MVEIYVKHFEFYQNVPGGRLVHKQCIYKVANNAFVQQVEDITIVRHGKNVQVLPKCEYPVLNQEFLEDEEVREMLSQKNIDAALHGVAWKTWTQFHDTAGFSNVSASWNVPSNPSINAFQILYFWPGTEPDDNSFVLQPVLQYGSTPAGGGYYWGVASWMVGNFNTVVSPLIKVSVGDEVFGQMYQFPNKTWVINGTTKTTNDVATIYYTTDIVQTYSYCVLEAYNLENCKQYPQSDTFVSFTNLFNYVKGQLTPNSWDVETKEPRKCNELASVVSPNEVHINFSNS
eukprot:TRINITY_DN208_c0_g6_i1.p1 TRINITY_DN208_c0_g6~~TRINITY_DN208_c0_g6_i1.p1  ORF type:complete len:334 (+),score=100.36 TRINITY_DN208_c0_g6_i1:139-1002(+)